MMATNTKLIIALLLCLSPYVMYGGVWVKGSVTDRQGETIPGAVLVLQDTSGFVVSSAETDVNGAYTLTADHAGPHKISASAFSFRDTTLTVQLTGENQRLAPIVLTSTERIDAATVSAKRRYVSSSVDGYAYDVSSDPEGAGLTSRELMTRMPFVTIEPKTNKLLVFGGNNFEITINGRRSALITEDNQEYLTKLLKGDKLKSIRLITQTRGEFAGKNAVIDITTKEDIGDLVAGLLSADASTKVSAGAGLGFTSKAGKLIYSVNYDYNFTNARATNVSTRTQYTEDNPEYASSEYFSTTDPEKAHRHAVSFNSSYDISDLSRVFASGSATIDKEHSLLTSGNSLFDKTGALVSSSESDGTGDTGNNQFTASASWQRRFENHPSRLLTVQYQFDGKSGRSRIEQFLKQSGITTPSLLTNSTINNEHTASVDFGDQLKVGEYYLTAKYINRFYDSDGYDLNYRQQIGGLKASWSAMTAKIMVSADVEGQIVSDYSTVPDILYNLRLTWMPAPRHRIVFSTARDAFRPDIKYLNPYEDRSVPGLVVKGNPDLQNEHKYSALLLYNYNIGTSFALSLTGAYNWSGNGVYSVDEALEDGTMLRTYRNLGKSSNLLLSAGINIQPFKWWQISLNAREGYFSFSMPEYRNSYWSPYFNGTSSFDLWKGARLTAFGHWTDSFMRIGPRAQSGESYHYVTGGIIYEQSIGSSLNLFVTASDFWAKDIEEKLSYSTPEFTSLQTTVRPGRYISVGFRYNFGKFRENVGFNIREIFNTDRTKLQ